MRHRRRATRVAALGTAAALLVSGLALGASATALAAAPAAPAAPPAPTALSPSSTGQVQKNLELTWSAVPGATSYDVRLFAGDDDPASDAATVLSVGTSVNRWTVPVSLPRDSYHWQVRAHQAGTTGAWSRTATFVRGWGDAPTAATTTAQVDGSPLPTFSWNEVPDASFYEVEVSDYPFDSSSSVQTGTSRSWTYYTAHTTFAPYGVAAGPEADVAPGTSNGAIAVDSKGDASETSIGTKFTLGKRYYWRVRGRDGSVDTRTTPFRAPAKGCTGVWSESDNTISDNGTPDDPSDDTVTVPVPAKAPTYAGTPDCSRWLVGQSFVPTVTALDPGRPAEPSGLSVGPAAAGGTSSADDVTVSDSPSFSWTPVPGAVKYRVTLSRTADLSDADVIWETEASTLTPVSSLAIGSSGVYWSVQACTANRLCSLTGPVRHVRKVAAATVTPVSFEQDAGSVVATWTTQVQGSGRPAPRASADHYGLQLLDVSGEPVKVGGADSVLTDRVAPVDGPGTSHWSVPVTGLAEGTYRFRARAIDVTGRSLPWSAPSRAVVVDRTAPMVRLSSGSGVGGRTPVTLTFSEPVSGVSGATVGVSDGGGRVSGRLTVLSSTTARFTPSTTWRLGGRLTAWSTGGAVDRGHRSVLVGGTPVRARTVADSTDPSIVFTSGDTAWSTRTASDAIGRSYRATQDSAATAKRARATIDVYGSSVSVRVCKSPTSGNLQVWVDGRLRTTSRLYRSWTGCDASVAVTGLPAGAHQVRLVAVADGKRGTVGVDRVSVA